LISPNIYDWPASVPFFNGVFHAGGQAHDGGFTTGGVAVLLPEPGGRAFMDVEFRYAPKCSAAIVSWLISKVKNGTVFRVPVFNSPQLVPAADLGISISKADQSKGLPWSNAQSWDNGQNWDFEPVAIASAASLDGTTTIHVDMGLLAKGVSHGHVIGHKDVAYVVDDITYSGSVATITITPPLRQDVVAGDLVTFRPRMRATVSNPENFRSLFERGKFIRPGGIVFVEAIV